MSKTAKIEARVLPARLERYRQAAEVLHLEEMSDFVRRACDHLAFEVLDATDEQATKDYVDKSAVKQHERADKLRDLARTQVTPRPRRG